MITTDSSLRHEMYISRLASGIVSARVNPAYYDLSEAVRLALIDYAPDMPRKEFDALRREVQAEAEKQLKAMWQGVTQDLVDLANYEAGYTAKELSGVTPVASAVAAGTASELVLTSGTLTRVGTWDEYVRGAIDSTKTRIIDNTIRAGREEGLTQQQMVKKLVGLKKNDYADGLLTNTGRREAETLVRTGASHYANRSRDVAAAANADLLEGKVFVATFDSRTTLTCRHFGQLKKIYALDDRSAPVLPLHYNERSIYSLVPKGFDPFDGTRAAVGGQKGEEAKAEFEARQERLDKRRAKNAERRAEGEQDVPTVPTKPTYKGSKDGDIFKAGQIDASTSMDSWLREQPSWFQDSALGPTRAKLMREGGLTVDKFTDMNGKPLTLKQMRELDEYDSAFRKAGLK